MERGDGDLHPARPARTSCDVLVIGAGPSGASAAYWLADAGYDVLVVEKKHFPRAKTCGDGLTPRSVRQLTDMGLASVLAGHHRYDGLRALAFGKELHLAWPSHPDYPSHGYVITRHDLDQLVAARAEKAGATLWQGAEAVEPLHPSGGGGAGFSGSGDSGGAGFSGSGGAGFSGSGDSGGSGFGGPGFGGSDTPGAGGRPAGRARAAARDGAAGRARAAGRAWAAGRRGGAPGPMGAGMLRDTPIGGAIVRDTARGTTTEVSARYVIVADGANSRFGRAIGAARDKSLPLGMAIRGYYASPRHDEPWIESHLDLRSKDGSVIPGYGWIFPLGDGRVNVGVGILSTFDRWRDVNTTKLMDAFVAYAPASWDLGPHSACGAPTGGRLPMGLSVGPHVGADFLLAGDAGGSINPFNGEGIAYGYETGRLAAQTVAEALAAGDAAQLRHYDERLLETYGLYYKVAKASMRALGNPTVLRRLVATGMHSRSVMEWVLRIMSNLLRPDELGPAEAAYAALTWLANRA